MGEPYAHPRIYSRKSDAKKKKTPTDYLSQWGRGLGKQGLPTDGTRHVPRKDNRSEALSS